MLQTEVAADAVLLVHHRGAVVQLGEVAHHLLGVAAGLAPARLADALAQQLGLGDQRQADASGSTMPCSTRRGGDRQAGVAVEKFGPAVATADGWMPKPPRVSIRASAPTGAFGDEEHAALEGGEEVLQQTRRPRRAGLESQAVAACRVQVGEGGVALAPLRAPRGSDRRCRRGL